MIVQWILAWVKGHGKAIASFILSLLMSLYALTGIAGYQLDLHAWLGVILMALGVGVGTSSVTNVPRTAVPASAIAALKGSSMAEKGGN